MSTFAELGLNNNILSSIEKMGYETPSDIQTRAIPLILEGKDIVGLSQTGSGKTAAFSLPLLQKLEFPINGPQVLVVCPTRELSQQVAKAIQDFAKDTSQLKVANLYGGAPYPEQLNQLRQKPAVVVGTPGRLQDHLKRKSFKTDEITAVVLDEADRMLDMGFRDEIKELLSGIPDDRQNIFFSATINPGIRKLIDRFSNDAEIVQVSGKPKPANTITQGWIDVREGSKLEVLRRLILRDQPKQAVIFCNTKRRVEEAAEALTTLGVSAEKLHGDMTQPMRERVISRFHDGSVKLLIATDVAGRGLDVAGIEAVYVLEMSHDAEDYVHRIGRTGRAGRSGSAFSLVSRRDFRYLKNVERYIGDPVPRVDLPSSDDLTKGHEKALVQKLMKQMGITVSPDEPVGEDEDTPENEEAEVTGFEEFIASCVASEIPTEEIVEGLVEAWKKDTRPKLNSIPEDRPDGAKGDRPERERDRNNGDRRERREHSAEGFTTLFVGLGKEDDINPGQITGMFYNEAQLPSGSVGRIQLFNRHSLVDVKSEFASKVMSAHINHQGRKVPIREDQGIPKGGDRRRGSGGGGGGFRGGNRGGGGGYRGGGDRDRGGRDRDRGGDRGDRGGRDRDRGDRGDRRQRRG